MENSWFIVTEDDIDSGKILDNRRTETVIDESLNSSVTDLNSDKKDQIKDLRDIDEVRINDVLSLLADSNSKKLQSFVKVSTDKSLSQKNATNYENEIDYKQLTRYNDSTSKLNKSQKIKDNMSALSNKNKSFIFSATNTNGPKSLTESAKEINQIKKSHTIAAAIDEMNNVLRDDDNIVYKMENIRNNHIQIPAKIISPIHDDPKISVEQLLLDNQSDAQYLISTIKQKNKGYLENIFDI